jgi:hypothetical protein
LRDDETRLLADLVARRCQIVEMIVAERRRGSDKISRVRCSLIAVAESSSPCSTPSSGRKAMARKPLDAKAEKAVLARRLVILSKAPLG